MTVFPWTIDDAMYELHHNRDIIGPNGTVRVSELTINGVRCKDGFVSYRLLASVYRLPEGRPCGLDRTCHREGE